MRRLALATFLLALAAPGSASAARFGDRSRGRCRQPGRRPADRGADRQPGLPDRAVRPLRPRSDAASLSSVTGVAWVERIRASRRLMFTPSDPFADPSVVPEPDPCLRRVVAGSESRGRPRRHPRLRHRLGSSGAPEPDRGRQELRRQLVGERHERSRHVRRRRDRRGAEQRPGDRRRRLSRVAARGEDRPFRRDDLARRGGRRDPLGRRQRRARDQHELRRRSRSARPGRRHVLAAGGRCRALRRRQGRPRGRRCRQCGQCADGALGLRRLPGGAPARARSERDRARRHCSELLEPRPPPQRHRGSGRGDLLDATEGAHLGTKPVPAPGLLGLRPGGVPARRGDVVLGSASRGGGGGALRSRAVGDGRPGRERSHAVCRRRGPGHRMRSLLDRPRRAHRLGPARRRERGHAG